MLIFNHKINHANDVNHDDANDDAVIGKRLAGNGWVVVITLKPKESEHHVVFILTKLARSLVMDLGQNSFR